MLFDNVSYNLLICLLINVCYITGLEVCPVPLRFFIRNSKTLMRLGVLFLTVFSFKMLCSYFFMKNAYTAKITLDVKNCVYAAYELGNSLHVRRNFWSLTDLVRLI